MPCRITICNEWALRMWHEVQSSGLPAHFITLTYNEESNPYGLSKVVAQKWLKRFRYYCTGEKVRYLLGAEYGDEGLRPHYHVALSGYSPNKYICYRFGRYTTRELEDSWPYGYADIEPLTKEKCKYVVKYITQSDSRDYKRFGVTPPFRLQSKGLGRSWLVANAGEIISRGGLFSRRRPVGLPRYYREKLEMPCSDEYLSDVGEKHFESLQRFPEEQWEHKLAEWREIKEYDLKSLQKPNPNKVGF